MKIFLTLSFLMSATIQIANADSAEGGLVKILKKFVSPYETLVPIFENPDEDYMSIIKSNFYRIIVDLNKPINVFRPVSCTFILAFGNRKWILEMLVLLKNSTLWNKKDNHLKRLFLLTADRDVEEMSKMLLDHQIFNVTLIQKRKKFKQTNVKKYTYKVMEDIVQAPEVNYIMYIKKNNPDNEPVLKAIDEVMFKSLQVIGDKVGVRIKTVAENEFYYVDDTTDDCIYLGMYLFNTGPQIRLKYDISDSIFVDSLTCIIPRIKRKNSIESLIFVFHWKTWTVMLITILLFILISWSGSRLLKERPALLHRLSWCFTVLSIMVFIPAPFSPRSTSLRILMIIFIFCCFQLSNLFLATFVSVLMDPVTDPEIQTAKQFLKSPIKLLIRRYDIQFLEHLDCASNADKIVFSQSQSTTGTMREAADQNYAAIMGKELLRYVHPQYKRKFYPLEYGKEYLYNIGFLMKKDHHFLRTLNRISREIHEAGLYEKMMTDIQNENDVPIVLKDDEVEIYLTFHHLKWAFLFLLFGLTISTIVFFGEILYHYGRPN